MSLKGEIAELIEWLAEITADPPGGPEPVPLPRDEWQLVRDNLENAAQKFTEAGDLYLRLNRGWPGRVAAELAHDLGFEAQSLADRAYVLGRRARPKVEESADVLARKLDFMTTKLLKLKAQVERLKDEVRMLEAGAPVAAPKPERTPAPQKPDAPADLIDDGQRSVATARDHLFNVTPAKQVVVDFAEDLEVLNDLIAGWRRVSRRSA